MSTAKDPARTASLREFFDEYYLPIRLGASKKQAKTADSYRQVLSIWEQIMGEGVAISQITAKELVRFRDALAERTWRGRPLSANTVRKHFRHLTAILNFAGPKSRSVRDAVGVLDEVPWVKLPREVRREPKPAARESIARLFEVLDKARLPTGPFFPGDWWRLYYMLALNTAIRCNSLLAFKREYVGEHELFVPGEETKGYKDLRVPLLPAAAAAIKAMEGYTGELLLPVEEQHLSTIHAENSRLNRLAGLKGDARVTSQSVRRYVLTQLGSRNPTAAQQAGSHASYETTIKHYLSSQILADTVASLNLCQFP